ncbi:metal ABC transporter solute-binding protein, Zn/Mn family [Streptomyces sp. RPT161]|uniref:metal ABC transporter solute-binding protein, Zn/Mn family n=1 Tax=Streptomyces sp. RPT161 TaxID=3015993 RepID=UPI0022B8A2F6|nr:zinc ABC transporter substrate-binding protein [Streptomyces sp. RPT161]
MSAAPASRPARSSIRTGLIAAVAALTAVTATACSSSSSKTGAASTGKTIQVVAAENEYADVVSQIGGQYVSVTGIMSNPNTDPHTFEANPKVAHTVSSAQLIVQNGVGYDDFMGKTEQASSNSHRQVIDVQKLLGLPDSTPNPHLWFKPTTMPAVAKAIAADLSAMDPSHKADFEANAAKFDNSLQPWNQAISQLKASAPGAAVATTEPVADYLLDALGFKNLTPWAFQADVMNGTDPSPQDVATEKALFTQHKAKVFVYNQQVTDSLTQSLMTLAKQNNIPVVGVYETMPTPGYTYQSWMNAEVSALRNAVANGKSAPTL